jgi:hypothetical protein
MGQELASADVEAVIPAKRNRLTQIPHHQSPGLNIFSSNSLLSQ